MIRECEDVESARRLIEACGAVEGGSDCGCLDADEYRCYELRHELSRSAHFDEYCGCCRCHEKDLEA